MHLVHSSEKLVSSLTYSSRRISRVGRIFTYLVSLEFGHKTFLLTLKRDPEVGEQVEAHYSPHIVLYVDVHLLQAGVIAVDNDGNRLLHPACIHGMVQARVEGWARLLTQTGDQNIVVKVVIVTFAEGLDAGNSSIERHYRALVTKPPLGAFQRLRDVAGGGSHSWIKGLDRARSHGDRMKPVVKDRC